jgi:hypothetical protein
MRMWAYSLFVLFFVGSAHPLDKWVLLHHYFQTSEILPLDQSGEPTASIIGATKLGATPQSVESIVGRRATINTVRDGKQCLRIADIEVDGMKKRTWVEGSEEIVYWVYPSDTFITEFRGIRWFKNGSMQLFTGRVYPK